MLRTIRALLASGILVVFLPLPATAGEKDDEMVDNPMYTAWAKFKPGATSTVSQHTTYSGDTARSRTGKRSPTSWRASRLTRSLSVP